MTEEKKDNSFRDILRTVFRRRWLFLGSSALVTILLLVLMHSWPKEYTATAVLEVLNKDLLTTGGKTDSGYAKLRQTAPIWLSSRPQVEKALAECDVFDDLARTEDKGILTESAQREKQDLITEHSANLSVKPQVRSDSVDRYLISFTSSDQELAMNLPNRLMVNFTPMLKDEIESQLSAQKQHLDKLISAAETELNLAKQDRLRFVKENHGPPPGDIWHIDSQLKIIRDQLQQRETEKAIAELKLKAFQNEFARFQSQKEKDGQTQEEVKVMGPNPKLLEMQDQLEQAQEGLEILTEVQKKTDKHPDVVQQRNQISYLEKKIAKEPREIELERHVYPARNGQLDPSFHIELTSLEYRVENLGKDIEQKKEDVARLEYQRSRYEQLSREYQRMLTREENAAAKLTRLNVDAEKVEQNLRDEVANRRTGVITRQMATFPYRPSSPKFLMVIAMSIGGGLAVGAGLVFLSHILDRTIATPEEAAASFNLPVHGVIAEIVTPSVRRRRKLVRTLVIPVASVILSAGIGLGVMSNWLRLSRPAEFNRFQSAPTLFLSEKLVEPVRELFK
ncbi:MAG: GumC family protein [Phycisphaerae bacterium]